MGIFETEKIDLEIVLVQLKQKCYVANISK